MVQNPNVFVCHASEDKERFVLDFATKLRSKGIDAWVDRWEMVPGDSLVDKIFEEGIGEAQAMIVVISEHGVNKHWVREELNAGVVRKINGVSKLIPVVIGDVDESQIPESLKSTLWERIEDLNNYDAELESVVRSIYEHREKPPLGSPPAYAQMTIDTVPGLTELDSLVLKLCGEAQVQTGHRRAIFEPGIIFEQAEAMDISQNATLETLEVLDNRGYIKATTTGEGRIFTLRLTDYGFDGYARTYLPEYESLFKSVALQIVNHGKETSEDIAEALKQPSAIVEYILTKLESRRYIKAQEFKGDVQFTSLARLPNLNAGYEVNRQVRSNQDPAVSRRRR